jgi:hypothetical protein
LSIAREGAKEIEVSRDTGRTIHGVGEIRITVSTGNPTVSRSRSRGLEAAGMRPLSWWAIALGVSHFGLKKRCDKAGVELVRVRSRYYLSPKDISLVVDKTKTPKMHYYLNDLREQINKVFINEQ